MKIFAITAKPVMHSLSPVLHGFAMKHLGIDATFTRLAADSAEEALQLMKEIGISGINVSAPFKEAMIPLMDSIDSDAIDVGAVNTVILDEQGKLRGFNTDIDGVMGALTAHSLQVKGKKVLVLGSGGAAKAAVQALTRMDALPIVLARNQDALEAFSKKGIQTASLNAHSANALLTESCGVVSTIPSTLPMLEDLKLTLSHFFLNAEYKKDSILREKIPETGVLYIKGTEWLIHQAIRGFKLFTGQTVSSDVFTQALSQAKRRPYPLYFIGLMGSGKSTIGSAIAKEKNLSYVDLDRAIEKIDGRTIAQIFDQSGEDFFRTLEESTFLSQLAQEIECISCGGGIVAIDGIPELLRSSGTATWLWAKPDELAERVQKQNVRPLLNGKNPNIVLEELSRIRKELYARASSIIISTSRKSEQQIIERIMYEYNHGLSH